jgi:hypothetical protein
MKRRVEKKRLAREKSSESRAYKRWCGWHGRWWGHGQWLILADRLGMIGIGLSRHGGCVAKLKAPKT